MFTKFCKRKELQGSTSLVGKICWKIYQKCLRRIEVISFKILPCTAWLTNRYNVMKWLYTNKNWGKARITKKINSFECLSGNIQLGSGFSILVFFSSFYNRKVVSSGTKCHNKNTTNQEQSFKTVTLEVDPAIFF